MRSIPALASLLASIRRLACSPPSATETVYEMFGSTTPCLRAAGTKNCVVSSSAASCSSLEIRWPRNCRAQNVYGQLGYRLVGNHGIDLFGLKRTDGLCVAVVVRHVLLREPLAVAHEQLVEDNPVEEVVVKPKRTRKK